MEGRNMLRVGKILASAMCLLSICVAQSASAATQVTPVRIFIDSNGRGVVTVSNTGTSAVLHQVSPFNWQQSEGEDLMSPTRDFIASPPSFSLKPGGKRDVRLGFRSASPKPVERAYRLVIEEVPPKIKQSNGALGVSVAVRHVLPVFIAASTEVAAPELRWSARRDGDSIVVRCQNLGAKHASFDQIGFSTGGSAEPSFTVNDYATVLAGGSHDWKVKIPAKLSGERWTKIMVRPLREKSFASYPIKLTP